MNKLNSILLGILVLCAWSVVTSQHVSRQLYSNLEREQKSAKQLEVEYGQLLLEQSTWGAHALIEKTATVRLGMQTPDQRQVQVVTPVGGT
ncbi:cell division protein FtsL [Pseudogulbenkiania sp. MAI-1]|uniref:cell division protein FtsL n=1 Tax=Pseudogulbenkiania sp. MAI-1 TaxID=990370 RepID=UPI00045E92E2|nr:cell division protein FtsL [Pseudogulbenkiania sp. MAI-1]